MLDATAGTAIDGAPCFAYRNCMIVPAHQARRRGTPCWEGAGAGLGGKIARSS
jgi:hypothetical protein